MGDKNVGQWL